MSRLRALVSTPRGVLAVLALIVVVGGALRAQQAIHGSHYQSADERSYARLAIDIATRHHYGDATTGMSQPLHWPPGAPFLFALAYKVHPSAHHSTLITAIRWEQWLFGILLIGVTFLLARMLAGDAAALVAAAVIALYPPLIIGTSQQLSEPLGALVVAAAVLLIAWAVRAGRWWRYGLAGVALGAAVLVRADLLVAPFLVALVLIRPRGWRAAAALAAGTVIAIAPWTIYASARQHQFVPVTTGAGSALFVGTYLPGKGETFDMKRKLAAETRRKVPKARHFSNPLAIPATYVLQAVAARNPGLSHDSSLRKEGLKNIKRYVFRDPIGWAGMMVAKVSRMWTRYARGGAMHTSWEIRVLHILIVVASVAGLLYGLWRTRDVVLGAIVAIVVWSTVLHMLVISQGRYNLPLMPILVAGGVAGWLLAFRRRAEPEAIIDAWPPSELRPASAGPPGPGTSPHPSATS